MPPRERLSIDFAHDMKPICCIDADVYYLSIRLTELLKEDEVFKNLTDGAWDYYRNIVNYYFDRESTTMSIMDYVEEVLMWAFTNCGRRGYDKLHYWLDDQIKQKPE